jgi:hypothetical protein
LRPRLVSEKKPSHPLQNAKSNGRETDSIQELYSSRPLSTPTRSVSEVFKSIPR